MNKRPILVTGAAGFIGSHLVDHLLAQGKRIIAIDNFCDFYPRPIKERNITAARADKNYALLEADICDADLQQKLKAQCPDGVETIVHLAAMAGVRPSIKNPALYTRVNLDGTVNMLEAARTLGAEKFVFASSSSVYGNCPTTPFTEDMRVDEPISPYAATKKAGELLCHTYAHLHQLPVTCLRFFTVFGPRQRPDLAINKFLRMVSQDQPIPIFGDGSTSRDYTFVDDIVGGIVRAMDRCNSFHIYNLGGSHPVSLSELVATIERVTGKQAIIDRKPMQPGDVDRTYADLTRSKAELGYAPHTSLEDGIKQQWAWMQEATQ